jgi:hypothetical protein
MIMSGRDTRGPEDHDAPLQREGSRPLALLDEEREFRLLFGDALRHPFFVRSAGV